MPLDLGNICNIRLPREQMWRINREQKVYNRETPISDELLAMQRVQWISDLKDLTRCLEQEAFWARICDNTAPGDCGTVTCDINAAPRLEGKHLTYGRNFCKVDTFSVTDDECKNEITARQKIAMEMENTMSKLRRSLNEAILASLGSNATAPVLPPYFPSFITVNGSGEVEIPASYWNHDLIVYLITLAEFNDISMPNFLSGTALYHSYQNSGLNQLNASQRDERPKYDQLPMLWDIRYFDSIFGGQGGYLLDMGAFGFFNSYQWTNTTPMLQFQQKAISTYSINDMRMKWNNNGVMSDLKYDVAVQETCVVVNGLRKQKWDFEVKLSGGIHYAPADCNGKNGIIKLKIV